MESKIMVIHIVDNGPGINNEIEEKIFDPFFTTSNDSKKMGLGLAIALSIVSQHHGRIYFSKEKKKGSELIIQIPLEKRRNQ